MNYSHLVIAPLGLLLLYEYGRNEYILHKEKSLSFSGKVMEPKDVKDDKLSTSKIDNSPYSERLKEIINKIVNNFDDEDLHNLYHNVKNLKIKNIPLLERLVFNIRGIAVLGSYDPRNNSISTSNPNKNSFSHEVLHLSSSIKTPFGSIVGFRQIGLFKDIGDGLNEGYTELLNNRYFNNGNISGIYEVEQTFSSAIEDIIGKKRMESLYLRGNLKGLISILNLNYGFDLKEIEKFIVSIDVIHNLSLKSSMKSSNKSDDELKRMREAYLYAFCFIDKGYQRKIQESGYSHRITEKYFNNMNRLVTFARWEIGKTFSEEVAKINLESGYSIFEIMKKAHENKKRILGKKSF